MKFVRKPPQTDKALSERLQSAGWKKIKEPSNIAVAIVCSLPFALFKRVQCGNQLNVVRHGLYIKRHQGKGMQADKKRGAVNDGCF